MGLKVKEKKRRVVLYVYHCPVLSMARESLLGLGFSMNLCYCFSFGLKLLCGLRKTVVLVYMVMVDCCNR
jgi:hypothetical protein